MPDGAHGSTRRRAWGVAAGAVVILLAIVWAVPRLRQILVGGDEPVVTPGGELTPREASLAALLDRLERDPRLVPPMPREGTPIIAVTIGRSRNVVLGILGTRDTRLRRDLTLPLSPTGDALPPDFWLIASSRDSRQLYWVALPDMRRGFAEWVADEATGAIEGHEFETVRGMAWVRMPFFPDGGLELYPGRGTPAERHAPVGRLTLPAVSPAAPVATIVPDPRRREPGPPDRLRRDPQPPSGPVR